jgi:hypothetical protein
MALVREQQGCCARAHRDMLTASLGTLANGRGHQWSLLKTLFWIGIGHLDSAIQACHGIRSPTRASISL